MNEYNLLFAPFNGLHLVRWAAGGLPASGWWEYPQPTRRSWEEHTRMTRLMSYETSLHNPWYVWSEGQLVFGAVPDPHFPHRSWPYGGWSLGQLEPQP